MRHRSSPFSSVLAAVVLGMSGCGGTPSSTPTASSSRELSQADLEEQVAQRYEPKKRETLTATCEGPLPADDGATQDCAVTTGGKEVGVRARVTDADADDLGVETTPFLPPEMVADAIASSLEIQGYEGVVATCDGDLVGETGEAVVCSVETPQGDTTVHADVTSVDGLLINFDFKSA